MKDSIETEYKDGKPTCPECGHQDMKHIKIDKYNRLISNCLWCLSSGTLYYSNLTKCNSNFIDKIIKRLEYKHINSEGNVYKKKIESIKKEVNNEIIL